MLNDRRAEFVYDAARLAAIAAGAPVIPLPWRKREQDFKAQFLSVIDRQCGPNRKDSPEELHEDWVQAYLKNGWVYGEKYDREERTHPDMVPYAELGQLERDKDAVFVALCEIARQYIYEEKRNYPPTTRIIGACWHNLLGWICSGGFSLSHWPLSLPRYGRLS